MVSEKLFDKRTVNRNVNKKLVSQKDIDSYKKDMDDDLSRLEVIKAEDETADDMPTTEDYKE